MKSRSMSGPTLSDIDFKNEMASVWTTLNLNKIFKVSNRGHLVYVRSIQNGYGPSGYGEPSARPWMILSNVDAFKNSNLVYSLNSENSESLKTCIIVNKIRMSVPQYGECKDIVTNLRICGRKDQIKWDKSNIWPRLTTIYHKRLRSDRLLPCNLQK